MKKYLFIIFAFFQFNSIFSQTIQQIDSVSLKMCETLLGLSSDITDEAKLSMIVEKHVPSFYEKLNITSQSVADSVSNKIFYRLQRNCKTFVDLLTKTSENKSDWKTLSQKPKSEITKKDFSKFLNGGKYYYKQYDGDIVNVLITKNSWSETFEDNTISRLILHPKKDGEFQLEFIESDNLSRKNFSVKGDIYEYGLYKLENDIFDIWVFNKIDNVIHAFRLYPKK